MIYLNEKLMEMLMKRPGFKERLIAFFAPTIFPEMYSAFSITDFLNDRSKVRPTPYTYVFYMFLPGESIIKFDTPLNYNSINKNTGKITDMNGSLDIRLDHIGLSNKKKKMLEEDMDLYEVMTVYKPKQDRIWLLDYTPLGPPRSEKKPASQKLQQLVFGTY